MFDRDPAELWLIEDNDFDTMLLRRALKKLDLSIPQRFFLTSDDALAAYHTHRRPHLIITDWFQPNANAAGMILTIIQGEPPFPGLVVLSSSEDPAVIRDAYDAGATLYMEKPMHNTELVERLRAVIHTWFHHAVTRPTT